MPCVHTYIIDNIGTCSLCGEVKQFPWERGSPVIVWKKGDPGIKQVLEKEDDMATNNFEKHRHYEKHKEEILADLRSTGRPATIKKWKIPRVTMTQLEKRWISPQETRDLTKRSARESSFLGYRKLSTGRPAITPTNNLPSFPQFSNDWPESVQLKWFEIYAQLVSPNFLLPPSSP